MLLNSSNSKSVEISIGDFVGCQLNWVNPCVSLRVYSMARIEEAS